MIESVKFFFTAQIHVGENQDLNKATKLLSQCANWWLTPVHRLGKGNEYQWKKGKICPSVLKKDMQCTKIERVVLWMFLGVPSILVGGTLRGMAWICSKNFRTLYNDSVNLEEFKRTNQNEGEQYQKLLNEDDDLTIV